MSSKSTLLLLSLLVAIGFPSAADAGESSAFTAFSAGHADVVVSHRDGDSLRFGVIAWGPNWAWTGIEGATKSDQGATTGALTAKISGTGVPVRIDFRAARPDPKRLQLEYQLQAESATDLTLVVVELTPGKTFQGRDRRVHPGGAMIGSYNQRRIDALGQAP